MIHRFPENIRFDETGFTDPFRYCPNPLVKAAAESVISMIDRMESDESVPEAVVRGFSEGKMIGILVCKDESDGNIGFTCAFSGSVGGRSIIEGFVPPIFDLTDPSGYFKIKEAEISEINRKIEEICSSEITRTLHERLLHIREKMDKEILEAKERMAVAKSSRNRLRSQCQDMAILEALTKESQHEKAEFRRLKAYWEKQISAATEELKKQTDKISELKSERAAMSDSLQEWIFSQYIVHNATGGQATIREIFAAEGLTAPGGTGDCAAPKLLEHAFRNKLKPLAMGEFWYGDSPRTAVRTHGHFYPSCTSKCGPLLKFMMKGLDEIVKGPGDPVAHPHVIHEDDSIIIIDKPSGMPSVPGLDGHESLSEWLDRNICQVYQVHRLDMDTSGIMVFAKTQDAASFIQRQFEERSTSKTYRARLSPPDRQNRYYKTRATDSEQEGSISIPLSPDYDERPRQKADFTDGKEAVTEYRILSHNDDGTTDIVFHPHTGRTHQLRVHSAHILGLGRPILGDMLYGGSCTPSRLHLHAESISFIHPVTLAPVTFTSTKNCF